MRRVINTTIFLLALLPMWISANDNKWLHLYHKSADFNSLPLSEISEIYHYINSVGNETMVIATGDDELVLPVTDVRRCVIGENVPTIRIDIPSNPQLDNLVSKETYLDALISIEGEGVYDDVEGLSVSIKGRGNSTWGYPKKPYRLKFSKKTSILGFKKQKNFALIANYIDCSNMRNAIAFEAARLLEMPFTNHVQPVRLYFNGRLKGSYFITEKIGISSGSVDIDEDTGVLFELDTNYDESYKFRTPIYSLPVMIKDPDLDELAVLKGVAANELLKGWQEQFLQFEQAVANDTFVDMIDLQSLVNYVIVYNLCGNRELNWPKSVYVYRQNKSDKYHFGPVWDFDWAFTYDNGIEGKTPAEPLLSNWDPLKGSAFFRKMFTNRAFMRLFRQTWNDFLTNKYPLLLNYIEEYSKAIEPSTIENGTIWETVPGLARSSFKFDENKADLLKWLNERVAYISSHPNLGLY